MLEKMAKIGIVPGQPFDASKLGPEAREAFSLVPKIANEKIMLWLKEGIVAGDMKLENGWLFTTKTGIYGTSYIQRALITAIGLGANRPQDAVYPTSEGPSILESYAGARKVRDALPQGQLPPAEGFWSLTMYDKDYFFVPTRSTARASAPGKILNRTRMVLSTSTFRTKTPAPRRSRIGSLRLRTSLSLCCASTGRARKPRRSSTALGRFLRSRRWSDRDSLAKGAEPRSKQHQYRGPAVSARQRLQNLHCHRRRTGFRERICEQTCGIPPEQVVGNAGAVSRDGPSCGKFPLQMRQQEPT